jgi:hypothetical protein
MSLKRFLLIPLAVSILFFLWYGTQIAHDSLTIFMHLHFSPAVWVAIGVALILQFAGHWLRAVKAQTLLKPVKRSTMGNQFRAFSIGQLFNSLLPLRLGEFVRADILAQRLHLSYTFSLVMILIERTIDLAIVTIMGIISLLLLPTIPHTAPALMLLALLVTALALILIWILRRQPKWFRSGVKNTTRIFNPGVRDHLRFDVWTIRYGLQRTLTPRVLLVYGAETAIMWLLYLVSTGVLIVALLPGIALHDLFNLSIAPYLGIGVPAGPAALGAFSNTVKKVSELSTIAGGSEALNLTLLPWCLIVLPICVVGLLLLLFRTEEPFWAARPKTSSAQSIINKLERRENISEDLTTFLDSYFASGNLSEIVHRLESEGRFALIRFFRGGSDAITILAMEHGKRTVKKIIPLKFEDRLKAQYDWLHKYGGHGIVTTDNEVRGSDYYSIDIAYDPNTEAFYDYLHTEPVASSQKILSTSLRTLDSQVYTQKTPRHETDTFLDSYINKHITTCVTKAGTVDPNVLAAVEPKELIVNGVSYRNLRQCISTLREDPRILDDLLYFTGTPAVHGDMIVDNLLVNRKTSEPLIIDPAPDGNMFVGPVFDFAKLMQSLHHGYEFLLRDESPVELKNSNEINFQDQISEKYRKLDEFVRNELATEYLTPRERRAMLFHGAVLYLRRLKHQVYYTPVNTLKFYAIGVRGLNEFLSQYQ